MNERHTCYGSSVPVRVPLPPLVVRAGRAALAGLALAVGGALAGGASGAGRVHGGAGILGVARRVADRPGSRRAVAGGAAPSATPLGSPGGSSGAFPDLDARLLAALEQRPTTARRRSDSSSRRSSSRRRTRRPAPWESLVPGGMLLAAQVGRSGSPSPRSWRCALSIVADLRRHPGPVAARGAAGRGPAEPFEHARSSPKTPSVERGTGLLVLARFNGKRCPADVQLALTATPRASVQQMPMTKSLDDPLFAGRSAVEKDLTYAVRYGDDADPLVQGQRLRLPRPEAGRREAEVPGVHGCLKKSSSRTRAALPPSRGPRRPSRSA